MFAHKGSLGLFRRVSVAGATAAIGLVYILTAPNHGLHGADPSAQDALLVGDVAPSFVMDDLDSGEPVFLADLAGRTLRQPWKNASRQVVVLNFWASWSEPCKKEIEELSATVGKFAGQPVTVFLVNTMERAGTTAEAIKSIAAERGYRLRVLLDETGTVADRYGVQKLPATFVIDKYGVLRLLHYGPGSVAGGGLEATVVALAQQP